MCQKPCGFFDSPGQFPHQPIALPVFKTRCEQKLTSSKCKEKATPQSPTAACATVRRYPTPSKAGIFSRLAFDPDLFWFSSAAKQRTKMYMRELCVQLGKEQTQFIVYVRGKRSRTSLPQHDWVFSLSLVSLSLSVLHVSRWSPRQWYYVVLEANIGCFWYKHCGLRTNVAPAYFVKINWNGEKGWFGAKHHQLLATVVVFQNGSAPFLNQCKNWKQVCKCNSSSKNPPCKHQKIRTETESFRWLHKTGKVGKIFYSGGNELNTYYQRLVNTEVEWDKNAHGESD